VTDAQAAAPDEPGGRPLVATPHSSRIPSGCDAGKAASAQTAEVPEKNDEGLWQAHRTGAKHSLEERRLHAKWNRGRNERKGFAVRGVLVAMEATGGNCRAFSTQNPYPHDYGPWLASL
jgi:hypothetical protein